MSDDIVREFLVESNENLDLLDRELVFLEKEPQSRETLASVFRSIHTLKGTCGFLGFTKLELVAHVGENLLSKLRDGELMLTPESTTALLKMVDTIRQMLESIEQNGNEGERDDSKLIETLTALQKKPGESSGSKEAAVKKEAMPPADAAKPQKEEVQVKTMGEILVERGVATQDEVAQAVKTQEEGDPRRLGEILVEQGAVKPREIVDALQTQQVTRTAVSEASIRVNVDQLDKLMNLVGELVLARNQILQFTSATEDAGVATSTQRLNHITTELQEGVMKTRMQPIGNIWSKFPRTVRDVATACGKKVRIEMEGQGTELDKTIIESIKDPLTHLVRNSVDHGIESPEKRVAAGKPEEGKLLLRAFHEGGQVNIEISDDGAGLDSERIRKKAVQRGLITAEQATRLSEREVANLIFMPGFSTAEKVTNVSGRGVGMDVVKTNIEKIGGTVDVHSRPGAGTTVRMKIPLTLAIIPALIITSAGERYAIPQVNLLELVHVDEEKARTAMEYVHGAPVYRLRGKLLPLVHLDKELKIGEGTRTGSMNIVVLQADDVQFGLLVGEVNDTEEIVVKPLGKQLKAITAFAGATIMGDGKVALILDVRGIAQSAGVIDESREQVAAEAEMRFGQGAAGEQSESLLLVQLANGGRGAIPLRLVDRLEELPRLAVEMIGEQRVIQYRDKIMHLLVVDELMMERRRRPRKPSGYAVPSSGDTMHVVVHVDQKRHVGFIVGNILDVVDRPAGEEGAASRPGTLATQVIQNHVTEILDLEHLLGRAKHRLEKVQPLVHAEV
jgi:two-component system, chemotaxis family, sensor kinase CheA